MAIDIQIIAKAWPVLIGRAISIQYLNLAEINSNIDPQTSNLASTLMHQLTFNCHKIFSITSQIDVNSILMILNKLWH